MSKGQTAVEMHVIGAGVLLSGHGFYLVPSESDPTRCYVVEQLPTQLGCTCKDHFFRGRRCKHIQAVIAHKAQLQLAEADRASPGAATPHDPPGTAPPAKRPTPPRGTYFGARRQEPFSLLKR